MKDNKIPPEPLDKRLEKVKEMYEKGELTRSPEVDKAYKAKLAEIMEEWMTVEDYVLCTFLSAEVETIGEYKSAKAGTSDTYQSTLCDFPYDLPDGVQHWICWYTHKPSYLTVPYRSQILIFENPTEKKSVKWVGHSHIFII